VTHKVPQHEDVARSAFRLAALMHEAREVRFQRAPIDGAETTWSPPSSGAHSDPTLDTVMDARRSALSDAYVQAERALLLARVALHKAHADLGAALERWHGER
jgi:hypothetical protein